MNKLEANLSLFVITFFAAIQYVFLRNIPASVSHFAYLSITNMIGFILIFIVFFGELFRIDRKQVAQSFLLSLELFGYNIFMLMGTTAVDTTVSACVLSAYFIFIPLFSYLLFKQKPDRNMIAALCVVALGLFVFMGMDIKAMIDHHVLFLWVADLFFAAYILTTERLTARSNPAILARGQLFFNFVFAVIMWTAQSLYRGERMEIPGAPEFWGSVLFICFFIRGLYSVIQIYAQRYVSAFNTSLIFSTEILMTM
ncbi:MAG: EamA family transporter, partial [Lachnospiraceae bacterium]|nr:EamA family transporter [Lachnospiraceae bacterium]